MSAPDLVRVASVCLMGGALAFGLIACSVLTDVTTYTRTLPRVAIAAGFLAMAALTLCLGAAVYTATL